MSFSELLPSGPGTPPGIPLRDLILGALAEAFITRSSAIRSCAGCGRAPCLYHQEDVTAARDYEAAYAQVAAGSSRWRDLAVALAAGMN